MLRLASFISAATAAALTLSACGSSNPTTGGVGASASKQRDGIAFASCMRSHGVHNFPDPGGGSGGDVHLQASQRAGSGPSLSVNGVPVNAPAFQAAQRTCRKYLPHGGTITPQELASARKGALAMAACMRSHGVPNFPDPIVREGPNGGIGIELGVRSAGGAALNPSSPAFQAAQKVCGPLAKAGGP